MTTLAGTGHVLYDSRVDFRFRSIRSLCTCQLSIHESTSNIPWILNIFLHEQCASVEVLLTSEHTLTVTSVERQLGYFTRSRASEVWTFGQYSWSMSAFFVQLSSFLLPSGSVLAPNVMSQKPAGPMPPFSQWLPWKRHTTHKFSWSTWTMAVIQHVPCTLASWSIVKIRFKCANFFTPIKWKWKFCVLQGWLCKKRGLSLHVWNMEPDVFVPVIPLWVLLVAMLCYATWLFKCLNARLWDWILCDFSAI